MINYLTTDTLPEIVDKNKSNILYLLQEFTDGGISYKDLVAKVEANAVTAAKAISDAAAAQAKADSHDQPIIANAAAALAAQQKADQNAADIVKAVADINANAAAIARIINDGIGGYLGTFAAANGDDFTVLPQKANSKERSITEFLEGTEYFYQEWVWNDPDGWTKLGSKTDSHIHSQSAGISLADVAAQQDPKISAAVKALEDKVPKLTDIKYEKGKILSFAEQKTTGAFADRTLFSELELPSGIKSGGTFVISSADTSKGLLFGTPIGPANGTNTFKDANLYDGNNQPITAIEGQDVEKSNEIDTGIKYLYTALKDITNGEMN